MSEKTSLSLSPLFISLRVYSILSSFTPLLSSRGGEERERGIENFFYFLFFFIFYFYFCYDYYVFLVGSGKDEIRF